MLEQALVKEIGSSGDRENLLVQALGLLVLYTLKKKSNKKEKEEISDAEYTLQDAFKDAFRGRGNNKVPRYSSLANKLIPKPM